MSLKSVSIAFAFAATGLASAQVRITEWMYNDTPEFVELTNVGGGSIDLAGWSFDDDSAVPGSISLSAFGVVASGESVVFTEGVESEFRALWGLASTVKVIGGVGGSSNLGRNDQINIFDAAGSLVDRLTYGDQTFPGTLRTSNVSGNIPLAALGTNAVTSAVSSVIGDAYGSVRATNGQIGNPGRYAPVPEPTTLAALGLGGSAAMFRRRRKA